MVSTYLPTIMSSNSLALRLICVQISMANMVLLLLNIDVSDDISADNITANIIPRAPLEINVSINDKQS